MKTILKQALEFVGCLFFAVTLGHAAPGSAPPKFDEIYRLLRNNLDGVSQDELDRAAVAGLIKEFPGQVALIESKIDEGKPRTPAIPASLGKVAVYDDSYAYFRVGSVDRRLAEKFRAAYSDIVKTNKARIKGVILDLRFASGTDYASAAALADCFLNSEQPLLSWGAGSASATKKDNAITVPVAILVNSQTTGAAEALAAALREANIGLILGETTAGQANIFKEFTLDNGDKLRVATAQVKLGDGTALMHGVKPDIAVDESLADQRAYLEGPLQSPAPAGGWPQFVKYKFSRAPGRRAVAPSDQRGRIGPATAGGGKSRRRGRFNSRARS